MTNYQLLEENNNMVSILIMDNPQEIMANESRLDRIKYRIETFFEIRDRNSTISTEIYAGFVNFLTMSYILACNPTILSKSGIPIHNASSATCLATFIATMIAGIFGNVPIGCAPGVGLSAYFSYSVMSQINNDYNLGLFMIFLSGTIVLLMTLIKLTQTIIYYIPSFMKMATIVGMGLFLSLIGLVSSEIIIKSTDGSDSLLQLGNMTDWKIWLFLFNLLLITILEMRHIHGSMIISILSTALLYFIISGNWPTHFIDIPSFLNVNHIVNYDNLMKFIHLPIGSVIGIMSSFIMVMILDVGGVIFAITKIGNLPESKPRTKWALLSTSIGTMVASILGCSPIIVHIESIAGILVGGRTGLTAITTALLFGISIIISPLLNSLPTCSTAAITIFIGTLMMKQCKDINWDKYEIAVPAFLTIIMMPFTFSISYGIFFGLGSFFILKLFTNDFWIMIKNYFNKPEIIEREEVLLPGNISVMSSANSSDMDLSSS